MSYHSLWIKVTVVTYDGTVYPILLDVQNIKLVEQRENGQSKIHYGYWTKPMQYVITEPIDVVHRLMNGKSAYPPSVPATPLYHSPIIDDDNNNNNNNNNNISEPNSPLKVSGFKHKIGDVYDH